MRRTIWLLCLVAIGLATMSGCNRGENRKGNGNAVYYWRTTFKLNNSERLFLQKHDIKKMYVKFFDVSHVWDEGVVPVGTTIFIDSVPAGLEIVPTVFITAEAINKYPEFTDKMLTRILDMADANNIKFGEIQIDCDWNGESAESYFAFMKKFRKMLDKKNIRLSTTIRLSQFGNETPDADYGVLMCYNTGNMKDWKTDNSILDIKDVKPYMEKLVGCRLPLSVAFPCFSWNVTFYDDLYFSNIEYDYYDFTNKERFKKISENRYKMIKERDERLYLYTPEYIRHEEPSIKEILEIKEMILKNLPSQPKQFVIYHLDSANLSKFSDNDVEKIYR